MNDWLFKFQRHPTMLQQKMEEIYIRQLKANKKSPHIPTQPAPRLHVMFDCRCLLRGQVVAGLSWVKVIAPLIRAPYQ